MWTPDAAVKRLAGTIIFGLEVSGGNITEDSNTLKDLLIDGGFGGIHWLRGANITSDCRSTKPGHV
jgi:hypothetical protein